MTKQEIKDLAKAKLAGQGNQVDLGSALPTIVDEIIDLIPDGGGEILDLITKELSFDDTKTAQVSINNEKSAVIRLSGSAPGGGTCTIQVNDVNTDCDTIVIDTSSLSAGYGGVIIVLGNYIGWSGSSVPKGIVFKRYRTADASFMYRLNMDDTVNA